MQHQIETERECIRFPCGQCRRAVASNHRGVCCDQCDKWFHIRCANITENKYNIRLSNSSEHWICNTYFRQTECIRFPCGQCRRAVANNHRVVCCDRCDKWFANITENEYIRLSNTPENPLILKEQVVKIWYNLKVNKQHYV